MSATCALGKSHASGHRPRRPTGDLMTIRKAAAVLGVAPSTIHRAINDGAIVGEQITVGAPWRIQLTDELRARFSAAFPILVVGRPPH